MNLQTHFLRTGDVIATTRQLRSAGFTERVIAQAVQAGELVRARRGHYVPGDTDGATRQAVRVGGRLACVSAAASMGIFVFDATHTHVHLERSRSRLRLPKMQRDGNLALHWAPLIDEEMAREHRVGVKDCLAQMVRCQETRMAIASIDSALHQGLVDLADVHDLFAHLPKRFLPMAARVNGRSESGQESVLRLLVEDMGLSYKLQVPISGVGRVDMVIEGVLVVEADSRAHHKEWSQHVLDRARDRLVAARGYMTLRLLYRDIMFDAEGVRAAIRGLLAVHVVTARAQ